jgi:basic amino acid/polyamine antiporter, APA family
MVFGSYLHAIARRTPLAVALGLVSIVTFVHLCGISHGSIFQNFSTSLKIVLIIAFIMTGFAVGT